MGEHRHARTRGRTDALNALTKRFVCYQTDAVLSAFLVAAPMLLSVCGGARPRAKAITLMTDPSSASAVVRAYVVGNALPRHQGLDEAARKVLFQQGGTQLPN